MNDQCTQLTKYSNNEIMSFNDEMLEEHHHQLIIEIQKQTECLDDLKHKYKCYSNAFKDCKRNTSIKLKYTNVNLNNNTTICMSFNDCEIQMNSTLLAIFDRIAIIKDLNCCKNYALNEIENRINTQMIFDMDNLSLRARCNT